MSQVLKVLLAAVYLSLPINFAAANENYSFTANDSDFVIPVAKNEIKIMSYNVENMFDASHDAGKKDYEFLPLSSPEKNKCEKSGPFAKDCRTLDWTDAKVEMKIQQIKESVSTQGVLPDVLTLVEVENENVVSQIADALGFDGYYMTDSPDARGIDCAVLYRTDKLTPVKFVEQEVADAVSPTRNLSAAVFKLNSSLGGGVLAVLPNHWPSQGNVTKARTIVAQALRALVDDLRKTYAKESDFNFVISGDFNTISSDVPNPIDTILLDSSWSAHLSNVRDYAIKMNNPMIDKMPPGTYYYSGDSNWNELDHFFVSAGLTNNSGLEVDPMSFRINSPESLLKTLKNGVKVPFRYNHFANNPANLGFSDHLALVMKLVYK
jgi:predicted extracellular nuclease